MHDTDLYLQPVPPEFRVDVRPPGQVVLYLNDEPRVGHHRLIGAAFDVALAHTGSPDLQLTLGPDLALDPQVVWKRLLDRQGAIRHCRRIAIVLDGTGPPRGPGQSAGGNADMRWFGAGEEEEAGHWLRK